MSDPRPPSPRWYRLAGLIVVAGLVAAGAWWPYATTRIFDAVEAFDRLGPFGGEVALREAGTHTFWIEGTCLSCHDNDPAEYRAVATVAVNAPQGTALRLRPAPARVFNTARREGRSLWLFDAPRPGRYRVSLDFDTSGNWDNNPAQNIAISDGIGLPVRVVRPMFLLALGGIGLGAAISAVTWSRRRRYYARTAAP